MRRKRFRAMSDGINEVTGEDWPDPDTDGQVVPFSRGERRITKEMIKNRARGAEFLAEDPKSALSNVAKALLAEIEGAENSDLKGFATTEAERLLATIRICFDCLSDHDVIGVQSHLRLKGFLHRVER